MAHTYHVTISWDEEVGVWYVSDTDFPGLVAEADTQRELVRKIHQLVPELFEANRHLFDEAISETIPLQLTSSRLEAIKLVDSNIQSRHTANAVLVQAGLPKAF